MRIIVLHGNDTEKSYDRLQKFTSEARRRSWKVTEFNLEEVTNQSLFEQESFYILKEWKILTKKTLEKLKNYSGNLVIYSTGTIPSPSLNVLQADKVEKFELPILLWKFLDNMSVSGFHELLKTLAPEYILAMIAWKLKQKKSKLILELADIDVKAKTGKAPLVLSLDLFIAKHVQLKQ